MVFTDTSDHAHGWLPHSKPHGKICLLPGLPLLHGLPDVYEPDKQSSLLITSQDYQLRVEEVILTRTFPASTDSRGVL